MDDIKWANPAGATKSSLEDGMKDWVKQKTGLEFVSLPSLYRVNMPELMLIAVAMGYQPNEVEQARITQDQFYAKREINRRAGIKQPAEMPHPFRPSESGRFCVTCGMIKASRLHDPVTTLGGVKVALLLPNPDSEAAYEIARDAGASDMEGGLDADFDQKGAPF